GVLIQTDEATKDIALSYVIPGTPADHAGLHAGDVITAIDGTPAKNMSNQDASKLLRGKPGTTVHLSVATTAGETHPDVAVTRSEVQPPTVVFKMLPDAIGYIAVIAFGRATPNEFDTALLRVKDAGARAVVLDLRNDGGGYVDSALDIVSRFVARKPMLTIEERGVPPKTYSAADDVMLALPMTVLVNQYTASASEITAGALQDDGIGELVGTRTFGKGVMQTLTPLPDGAAIKITTAHYLTPLKRDINLKGIDPDVRIDENHDARFGEIGKDAQLRAALALLQKKIAQVP
ncbi:MAG TPA: S41 family peptidase, partial [Candidatus Baltobacteraceae bacterium]|nr:S41 family peptidase [Candidatus Baltobacteraceae bacterium]